MRYMMIITLFCLSISSFSQEMKCIDGVAQIQKVVEIEGKSASDIYKAAQHWIAKSFHNKDKVIQSEIENELIRGDGYEPGKVKLAFLVYSDLKYSFTIDIKDGRMRFTMNNLESKSSSGSYSVETYCCKKDGKVRTNGQSQNIKSSIEEFYQQLLKSFEAELNGKKDDW
jgi:hypothetical protein